MRTLHDWRWPFAAARASVWLALLSLLGIGEPSAGPFVQPVRIVHARPYLSRNNDLRLTLLGSGTAFVGSNWYPPSGVAEALRWLREHNPSSRVVLRADRYAKFGDVRRLLASARAAGYTRVTIDDGLWEPRLRRRLVTCCSLDFDRSRLVERDSGLDVFVVWD
jgi:hypothetical protein